MIGLLDKRNKMHQHTHLSADLFLQFRNNSTQDKRSRMKAVEIVNRHMKTVNFSIKNKTACSFPWGTDIFGWGKESSS